jgi:MFS family permease
MKLFFRGQRNVHKWLVLFFVLIFSLLSQWSRWLPVYLSSVRIKECVGPGVCKGIIYEPVCKECSETDEACLLCRACRIEYESEYYNFQDGVCMTRKQYGLITGFGFSLTFSIFGLVAGFFVDVSSERAATILGFSVLLGGVMAVLYSYCTHFDQVLLLRALLGGLQAFGAPASVSMITSHFKRASDRPFANAAYTVGLYLGAGMSSISTIIAEQYGWHAPFRLVGYCGIAVAAIFEIAVDLNVACVSQQKGGTSSSQATAISVPSYGTIKKNEYHPMYSPTGVHMPNRGGMTHGAGKGEITRSGGGKDSSRTAPTSDGEFFDEHDGMHRLDPDEMHHHHHHHSVHFEGEI